jgi:hypothetical protein
MARLSSQRHKPSSLPRIQAQFRGFRERVPRAFAAPEFSLAASGLAPAGVPALFRTAAIWHFYCLREGRPMVARVRRW